MSPNRQRALALACTIALFVIFSGVLLLKVRGWQRVGWSGVHFAIETKNKTERQVLGISHIAIGSVADVAYQSPGYVAGIQRRDRVVAINGIPTTQTETLKKLNSRVRSGDRIVFTVVRKGKTLTFPVSVRSPLSFTHRVVSLGVSVLVATIFLFIGLWIFWKKPGDLRSLLFYLLSTGVGSYFFLDWIDWEPRPLGFRMPSIGEEYADTTMTLAKAVTSSLFASCLLHLSLVFPRTRPLLKQKPWTTAWIYALPTASVSLGVLILLLGVASHLTVGPRFSTDPGLNLILGMTAHQLTPTTASGFLIVVGVLIALSLALLGRIRSIAKSEGWGPAFLSEPPTTIAAYLSFFVAAGIAFLVALQIANLPAPVIAYTAFFLCGMPILITFVLWAVYPLLAAAAFFASYRDSGVEERQQVRWPLWGTISAVLARFVIGGFAIFLFTVFGMEAAEKYGMYEEPLARMAYLLIPISFAIAIMKYRLMEIDIIIKKTIVYTALSALLLAIYVGLVGGLGTLLVKTARVENTTIVVVSTLAIAAAFVPARNRIQAVIDRRLFRKKHDYPQSLRALSHELPKATDLQALLRVTAEHLQQTIQTRNVVMFTRESETTLRPSVTVGLPDERVKTLRFEQGGGLEAVLTEPLAIESAMGSLPPAEVERLRVIRSAYLVPLRQHGELLGFISLGGKLSDEDYDLDDRDFLSSVADQLGIAIENLRLRREEREYETAREIQEGLLPREIPRVAGLDIAGMWQPARAVGGDYYDVLKLDDSRVALCIGDVVGKGMPAALLMSSLQATVKAVASATVAPKDLCEKVKQVVCHNLTAGKFITFFYAMVDADTKRLVYTNAGHNPPFLLRPDGTVRRLEEGGTALGRMFRGASYLQKEIDLTSGDRVVLFTDGVTEARNAAEEEFGEDRLVALFAQHPNLDAATLQSKLLEAVGEFTGGDFQDDVTVAILRVV